MNYLQISHHLCYVSYINIMNNNILIPFTISLIAGLSTLIGSLFIFVKPKNIDKFIGISLSFSATIMILISLLELIPEGLFYFLDKYGLIYSLIIFIFIMFIGYIINVSINKKINKNKTKNKKNSSLYRVGNLSMIALMIHNLPEGILTFLTSSIDMKLGIKLSLAIMMHNIPEGIAIAVPIYYSTKSKFKAITNTLISGLSEPLGAILAYLFLYQFMSDTMISLILLFVASIMITISINDIFEEARNYSKKDNFIGLIVGLIFILMTKIVI